MRFVSRDAGGRRGGAGGEAASGGEKRLCSETAKLELTGGQAAARWRWWMSTSCWSRRRNVSKQAANEAQLPSCAWR